MNITKTAILLTMLTTIMTGCGYGLRGTVNNPSSSIAPVYQTVNLILDDSRTAFELKQPLIKRLALLNVKATANTTKASAQSVSPMHNTIDIKNLKFQRYELIGVLTEVRLVLSADITYTLGDTTHKDSLQVERSYQFNEAGVATIDQQSTQVQQWLYQALAERISEQYYALTQAQNTTP